MEHIQFIPAGCGDLRTIAELRKQIWETTYRGIHTDEMIDHFNFDWHIEKDRRKLIDSSFHVYLLALDGQIVGYLMYQFQNEILHLHSLNIIKPAQRKGLGRAALAHVRAFGQDMGVYLFHLQCNPWNNNALAFYQAMGGVIFREDLENEERYMDTVWFRFPV